MYPPPRTFFESTFHQLQAGLFASSPAAFPASAFTYRNFLWAVAAVRSHSHAPLTGAKLALVPVADLVGGRAGTCVCVGECVCVFARVCMGLLGFKRVRKVPRDDRRCGLDA